MKTPTDVEYRTLRFLEQFADGWTPPSTPSAARRPVSRRGPARRYPPRAAWPPTPTPRGAATFSGWSAPATESPPARTPPGWKNGWPACRGISTGSRHACGRTTSPPDGGFAAVRYRWWHCTSRRNAPRSSSGSRAASRRARCRGSICPTASSAPPAGWNSSSCLLRCKTCAF